MEIEKGLLIRGGGGGEVLCIGLGTRNVRPTRVRPREKEKRRSEGDSKKKEELPIPKGGRRELRFPLEKQPAQRETSTGRTKVRRLGNEKNGSAKTTTSLAGEKEGKGSREEELRNREWGGRSGKKSRAVSDDLVSRNRQGNITHRRR